MAMLSSVIESDLDAVAAASESIDCLIIGSGTSGVTTALELANQGLNVVILEAGPFMLEQHIGSSPFCTREELVPAIHQLVRYGTAWHDSETVEKANGPLPENNNAWSLVGGRTVFWGGCTPRFIAADFDDWPFSLDELAPYYDRGEDVMHVSGSRAEARPAFFDSPGQARLIKQLNDAGIGASRMQLCVDTEAVHNGHVSRGFDSSIGRLLNSGQLVKFGQGPGVSLVAQAAVTALHQSGDRIDAVTVLDRRRDRVLTLRPRHICLCGGAIQSSRLALASNLETGCDDVGRYINDHLFVQGVLTLDKPLGDGAYLFVESTTERRFQIQLQGTFQETWYSPYHATVWLATDPEGLYFLFYCFGVGTVSRDNRIELNGQLDPTSGGMRDYRVVYDRSDSDNALIEEMQAFMPRVGSSMGGKIEKMQVNPPGSALHEIGGLRMGREPGDGVTDSNGRFWKIRNLSAHDASIWRSQGAANSYLTITAMALRCSERLAADLTGGR
jgi:choline dehydrogenase-like flavoprotein